VKTSSSHFPGPVASRPRLGLDESRHYGLTVRTFTVKIMMRLGLATLN